jgi:conjugative relaxase-like TrwC/TraI family protein
MLSLGKLAPGQQAYYLDTVANGAEEYYTGAKEAPGEWVGHSAALLELAGEVEAAQLHRVLEHRDPHTGTRLTRGQGAPSIPGFDATFCAPKSVSLLYALGDPETSNAVRNAHDAAVRRAFAVLEAETARARRGKGGVERLEAEGLVSAAFRHRTSRAGDPHLHTHVVIANLVHVEADGRWSALDARALYPWCKPVGYLYEAQLRHELTTRLGLEWREVHNGIAEMEGIPQATLRAFSQRRIEIEAYLAQTGATSARAAQFATKATRRAKDQEANPEGLLPEWRHRAEELGLDAEALAAVLRRGASLQTPRPGSPEAEELFAQLASPEGLTAKVAAFTRREVLMGICAALPQGGEIADILELADAFLVSEHVVALGAPDPSRAEVIHLADGRVVPAHTDTARFTTPEMLATEAQLLDSALSRRDDGVGVAAPHAVAAAIDERPLLSVEQLTMVRRVCESRAGVDVVVGVAGAGKTYALAAAHGAWRASSCHVIGVAIAARAAAELQTQTAIPSMTLDRLLVELSRRDSSGSARTRSSWWTRRPWRAPASSPPCSTTPRPAAPRLCWWAMTASCRPSMRVGPSPPSPASSVRLSSPTTDASASTGSERHWPSCASVRSRTRSMPIRLMTASSWGSPGRRCGRSWCATGGRRASAASPRSCSPLVSPRSTR